jgi:Gram-negative porin
MKWYKEEQHSAIPSTPSDFPEGQRKEGKMRDKQRAVSCHILFMVLAFWAVFATAAHAQQFGATESFVEIHGYVDMSYFDFQKPGDPDLPFTDGGTGVSSFDNNHMVLFFGSNLSQNLKFVSEFHYEHSFNEPELPAANIQWTVAKPVTIVLGRFWLPFGTLGTMKIYQPTNGLVSYPYPVAQALPFHNAQNGVKLMGELHPFHYELAIGNGFAGLDEDGGKKLAALAEDNNQNKEFTGRVALDISEGTYIGASYTTGKWDDNNDANISLWGADARVVVGPLELQGEYLGGKVQNPSDAMATVDGVVRCNTLTVGCDEGDALRDNMGSLSPGDHNRTAYYAQAALEVLKDQLGMSSATVIVRYDAFMRDEPGDVGDRSRVVAGINIMPQPHFHLKAEYQVIKEPGKQKSVDNNGVMAQAVVDF